MPRVARAAAPPGPGPAEQSSDERLHSLFWNRAELKKAYSNLRDDRNQLIDKLRDQHALTTRAEERMRELEAVLANPKTAYNAMVYYQLRALWTSCTEQLQEFGEELKKQQHDRERKKQIMEFNMARDKRLHAVGHEIQSVKVESDKRKAAVQVVEGRLAGLQGFWNYFKRRSMQEVLTARRAELSEVREKIEELFDRRIKIESEQWPDYPGLGLDGKRVINIAVLALTQHLYIGLTENSLGELARGAHMKPLKDVKYGTPSDCEYLMDRIREAGRDMRRERGYADELRARAAALRKRAEYRNESDTVPLPESVGSISMPVATGDMERTIADVPVEVNVMGEDYWNVNSVMLR